MTSGDVLCFTIRAVQFRRANDHFSFGRIRSWLGRKSLVAAARVACAEAVWETITSLSVGLEVGWEGRVGWQRQEWLALKQFGIINFMHLSFTNVKQSKLNFLI